MTVHKITLCYSKNGADELHQWLRTWHPSVTTKTSDAITNEIPDNARTTPDIDNQWFSATFTYHTTEDITELQLLYDKLMEYCEWSKAGYHYCPDVPENTDPHDCSIDESNIYRDGDIPEYIPSLN
jgi:hypothetical protein